MISFGERFSELPSGLQALAIAASLALVAAVWLVVMIVRDVCRHRQNLRELKAAAKEKGERHG
jgi:hypothetical protein